MPDLNTPESSILSLKPKALRILFFAHIKANRGCTRSDLGRAFGLHRGSLRAGRARVRLGRIVQEMARAGLIEECEPRPGVRHPWAVGLCVSGSAPPFEEWPETRPDPRTVNPDLKPRSRRPGLHAKLRAKRALAAGLAHRRIGGVSAEVAAPGGAETAEQGEGEQGSE